MSVSSRERFLGICRFERPGDLCLSEPYFNWPWGGTPREWVKQGAPEQIVDNRFRADYFQFEHMRMLHEISSSSGAGLGLRESADLGYGIKVGKGSPLLIPSYEPRIITEDERTITYMDSGGRIVRVSKENPERMPTFLDWPVKDRATWNEHKKRLDPNAPERWPSDWNTYVQRINSKDELVSIMVGGFFMHPREWVGSERILYMFYDDPNLVEDMMDTILHLEIEVIKRTLKDIKVQMAQFNEDMAWRGGPLVSPDMVRKFMMPRYKKITDLLRSYGVDIILVDSDGNLNELIPLWMESGINFVWPLEVAAHNDAVVLRKKYGRNLILGGNIDKRALIKGKDAIREEVMSKVPFLLEQGGYFPSVDHTIPPDVTFENYCHFVNTVREVAGLEKLPFQ